MGRYVVSRTSYSWKSLTTQNPTLNVSQIPWKTPRRIRLRSSLPVLLGIDPHTSQKRPEMLLIRKVQKEAEKNAHQGNQERREQKRKRSRWKRRQHTKNCLHQNLLYQMQV